MLPLNRRVVSVKKNKRLCSPTGPVVAFPVLFGLKKKERKQRAKKQTITNISQNMTKAPPEIN